MCTSSPKIPEAKQPQDATQVATLDQRRKNRNALNAAGGGGTVPDRARRDGAQHRRVDALGPDVGRQAHASAAAS